MLPSLGRNSRKWVEMGRLLSTTTCFDPVDLTPSAQPGKQQICPKHTHVGITTHYWYGVTQKNIFFSYKLVSSTKNAVDLNIAMGAPKEFTWMSKYFDDRMSIQNIGPDGLVSMVMSIRWKFCEYSKWSQRPEIQPIPKSFRYFSGPVRA